MKPAIGALIEKIPDYAKDVRNNLQSVLTEEGSPGLTLKQIFGCALACAYATHNTETAKRVMASIQFGFEPEYMNQIKSAVAVTAMINTHNSFKSILTESSSFSSLSSELALSTQETSTAIDYKIFCLAVAVYHGREKCIKEHIQKLTQLGVDVQAFGSVGRIASVIHALAQVNFIQSLT